MLQVFHTVSENCSRIVAEKYSTSFCSAIRLLHKDMRAPIFNIYGFVRFADEIVDTFHDHDKALLLSRFKNETYDAIDRGISLNPILHSFQLTVNEYGIDRQLIAAFFRSMELDLTKKVYNEEEYGEYIYGSAEVVGLMCLYIFTKSDMQMYHKLVPSARALGAAFQKVNFLRDLKEDTYSLARMYFPGCDFNNFLETDKKQIEDDIQHDFREAYLGILQLPVQARFGVYVAYKYYLSLFRKIKRTHPCHILQKRIRIPDHLKLMIVVRAGLKHQLKLI
ncbi:MAG: phytoene/squalene synthase family protein [Chitinophagaceae bacterium]|nr:phytoene/squalene synthase family protein [Chitinophagaceae bacterium]